MPNKWLDPLPINGKPAKDNGEDTKDHYRHHDKDQQPLEQFINYGIEFF